MTILTNNTRYSKKDIKIKTLITKFFIFNLDQIFTFKIKFKNLNGKSHPFHYLTLMILKVVIEDLGNEFQSKVFDFFSFF